MVILSLAPATALRAGETGEEARDWLDKMARASETLNYDGTFVYRNGENLQTMRIIHQADPEGGRERLISLSGTAREVLRDAARVTCIIPDNESVVVGKSRPRSMAFAAKFAQSGASNQNYELSVSVGERVAGRLTKVVYVKPRDEFRYGYRLWLDGDTGLLLKSVLLDSNSESLEQIMYTSISMPKEIPDTLLEPGISGTGYTWYNSVDEEGKPAADAGPAPEWRIEWLPPGFELSDRGEGPAPSSRMSVDHWVYTDGLASLSIFIERLESSSDQLDGLSTMGAIRAFGRLIDDFQVTVVGEVPEVTVVAVGNSIKHD